MRSFFIFITVMAFLCLCVSSQAKPPVKPTSHNKAHCTFYCCSCSSSMTASGKHASDITIAADPHYYPLGTKVWIEGFGTRIVQDTGGAIKGRGRFDIYLTSRGQCGRFGVRRLRYKILSHPRKIK